MRYKRDQRLICVTWWIRDHILACARVKGRMKGVVMGLDNRDLCVRWPYHHSAPTQKPDAFAVGAGMLKREDGGFVTTSSLALGSKVG